ncbi:RASD family member 3 [Esox lucius]|uniref:Uncharacterized protein n=1 Tax=Esox lucius TaxID=8010 RepID=A0A3P8YL40_ESOLU|nr:RASD family member 3 [Esox lucius]
MSPSVQSQCVNVPARMRLVLLGAAGVGKSSLIRRFLHNRFDHKYTRTVEELHALECSAGPEGPHMCIEILDTSGSYSFPAMRELSIKHSHAFCLVYAVNDPASFSEVIRLRQEILALRGGAERQGAGPAVMVVGNKADLRGGEGRVLVSGDVMSVVEQEWGAGFVEASALTGENTVEVFQALLQPVMSSHKDTVMSSHLSPALWRLRDTVPRVTKDRQKKKGLMKKNNSCLLS